MEQEKKDKLIAWIVVEIMIMAVIIALALM